MISDLKYSFYYNSPIGMLEIFIKDASVISLKLADKMKRDNAITAFTNEIKIELDEYFSGKRKTFSIKTELTGTNFQKRVWQELTKIPYGQTKTYGDIAELVGNKNAQRAVGHACNKNPIMIIVPCHRVLGRNGDLTGFACGINIKEKLLNLEKTI